MRRCTPKTLLSQLIATGLLNLVTGQEEGDSHLPRIYVYQLPVCSFDSLFDEDEHFPILALHRRILQSSFLTNDPAEASLFYLPAPFFLWRASSSDQVSSMHASLPQPYVRLSVSEENKGAFSLDEKILNTVLRSAGWTITFWVYLKSIRNMTTPVAIVTWPNETITYSLGLIDGSFGLISCSDGLHCQTIHLARAHTFWHYFAVIHIGDKLLLYKDGFLLAEISAGGETLLDDRADQNVQSFCSNASSFNGSVMDVNVFQAALTQKQIKTVRLSPNIQESTCFYILRTYIGQSAVLHRRMGWDHFILSDERLDCKSKEVDNRLQWPEFHRFASVLVSGNFTSCENPYCSYCRNSIVPPVQQAYADIPGDSTHSWRKSSKQATDATQCNPDYVGLGWDLVRRTTNSTFPDTDQLGGSSSYGTLHDDPLGPDFAKVFVSTRFDEFLFTTGDCSRWMVMPRSEVLEWYENEHRLILASHLSSNAYKARMYRRRDALEDPWITFMDHHAPPAYCNALYQENNHPPPCALGSLGALHQGLNVFIRTTSKDANSELGSESSRMGISSTLLPQLPQNFSVVPSTDSLRFIVALLWKAIEAVGLVANSGIESNDAETCLLIAGEPMFEAKLFRSIHSLCIPIIVYSSEHFLPQLPFAGFVPWQDFLFFWDLSCSCANISCREDIGDSEASDSPSFKMLTKWLSHLGAVCDSKASASRSLFLIEKRRALSKWAPSFEWHEGLMGLLAGELNRRANHMASLANDTMASWRNDTTVAAMLTRVACCNWSASVARDLASKHSHRFGLVSFSDRPRVKRHTRPSLMRFVAAHPGHYELKFYDESEVQVHPILHPAWNKLECMRRLLRTNKYDAVVWIDDDIIITDSSRDPIYDAILNLLLPNRDMFLLASRDSARGNRYPMNSGLFVLRNGTESLEFIDQLLEIALRQDGYMIDGVWLQPAYHGFWDQDAIALYVQTYGKDRFALLEHGILQSFSRQDYSIWQPGHFAAHLSGSRGKDRFTFTRKFTQLIQNLTHVRSKSPMWNDVLEQWRSYVATMDDQKT